MKFPQLLGALSLVLVACAGEDPVERSPLAITTLDSQTIAGSFEHEGSVIHFVSTSLDQRRANLHLDVNGAVIDTELDVAGTLHQDGYLATLDADDLAALLALRDAVNAAYPELVLGSLHGKFLSRHADWLADAPVGHTFDVQDVDVKAELANRTTNDDSIYNTCLTSGLWYNAYYDSGNGGSQWVWTRQASAYSGDCVGRCGAGCNPLDTDLMLDCFEHDSCIDHLGGSAGSSSNPNCGDEFNHAVSEYVVTYGAWCP